MLDQWNNLGGRLEEYREGIRRKFRGGLETHFRSSCMIDSFQGCAICRDRQVGRADSQCGSALFTFWSANGQSLACLDGACWFPRAFFRICVTERTEKIYLNL